VNLNQSNLDQDDETKNLIPVFMQGAIRTYRVLWRSISLSINCGGALPDNLIYYLVSSHCDLPHRETGHIVYLYGRNTPITIVSDLW
jgi:hypothetical protein